MNLKRPWTEVDDLMLRELADKLSPQRISARLSRSLNALKTRAGLLGISFKRRHVLRKRNSAPQRVESER